MKRKAYSFLLAIMVVASLSAGCNPNVTASPTPSGTAATPSPSATAAPTPGEMALPLKDTMTTFTAWMASGAFSPTAGMQSANDSLAYQELEKRTNIHIEWSHPSVGNEQENFNLSVASQNYPDTYIHLSPAFYIGGYDKYIEDNTILDLTELIKQNAPNYNALRNSTDDIRRRTMSDTGSVPYFRTINKTLQPSFFGTLVRQDWLDDAGYKGKPETYAEFREMLITLKDRSAAAPLYLFRNTGLDEELMVGYGVNSGFYQVDGKVKFGPIEPGFKEYITMMNTWYNEGLVDPEFHSRAGAFAGDSALFLNGDFGTFFSFYTMIDLWEMQAADERFTLSAVTTPVVNKGDTRKMTYYGIPDSMVGGSNATITTACKDPVTLTKWFDYLYTDAGSLLGNYGIPEAYTITNGKPVPTDLILANPNGLSVNDARSLYTITQYHPKWYDWERELVPTMSEKAKTAGSVWDANWDNTQTLPDITISTEESAEYSAIYTDIGTLVTESAAAFINGKKPLGEFDAFVDQIKNMNIDRAIEIQQAALDRYYKR